MGSIPVRVIKKHSQSQDWECFFMQPGRGIEQHGPPNFYSLYFSIMSLNSTAGDGGV